jgi:hypothetical protein
MREHALVAALVCLTACAHRAEVARPAPAAAPSAPDGAPAGPTAGLAAPEASTAGRAAAPDAAATPSTTEQVLASGGDTAIIDAPLSVGQSVVAVSASVEVPGDSRLQAALAMVDAITRAELCKTVAVAIVSLGSDRQVDSAAPEVMSYTAEATRVLLPALPLPAHAWRKVRRGDEVVLVLFGRLEVPRAQLATAVAKVLTARGQPGARADDVVARLAGEKR